MPCRVRRRSACSAFLWGFMPAAQPRDDRHKSGARRSVPGVEAGPAHAQPGGKIGIGADEVAGDPAEQHRAGPNEDGKTVEQREHERGAEDEERDRQGETDKDQQFRSFRRGGDRDHIVERHHGVGHGDDTDGGPQRVGRRDLFLRLFRAGELDSRSTAGERRPRSSRKAGPAIQQQKR